MLNMTVQEAKRINDLLVQGWMVREKLTRDAIPNLLAVSLAEAVRASEIIGRSRWKPLPSGGGGKRAPLLS